MKRITGLDVRPRMLVGIWLIFFGAQLGCSHPASYQPTYGQYEKTRREILLGVPSLSYNDPALPLVNFLNEHLDSVKIRMVACVSLEDFEEKIRKEYFDIMVINGPQLILAEQSNYRVVGKIADEYRSVIFSNKDSGINRLSDLKGRTISLTGRGVLAGSVMPLMYLHSQGVDINKDFKPRFTPSYESVLMDVSLGKSSAGAVWNTAYSNFLRQKPDLASRLELKWQTPTMVSSGLLFRQDMDKKMADTLMELIMHLHEDSIGRRALAHLGIHKFEIADSSSYTSMKAVIQEYNSLVH